MIVLLLVIVLEIAAFDYENEHRFAEHGAQPYSKPKVDPVRCPGLHHLAPLGQCARADASLLLPMDHPYGTTTNHFSL